MKKHKYSIAFRLFISFIVFAAITLGLLWTFQTLFLEDCYKAVKLKRVNLAIESVEKSLDEDTDLLQDKIDEIADYYDVNIAVYDSSLVRIAFSRISFNDALHSLRGGEVTELYKKATDNGGTYTERWNDKGPMAPNFDNQKENREAVEPPALSDSIAQNETSSTNEQPFYKEEHGKNEIQRDIENLITASIVNDEDGNKYTILLNSVLSPVTETIETLKIQLTAISIVMIVIALILALLIAKQIAKPIVKINETASELAKGNYEVTFDEKNGCREVSQLSTTLNYATNELSKVDRLRSELIANISHDLRTPLTMITGYSEIMRDIPGENTPENADIIIEESKKLSTLVSDVMDLSKYKSGGESLNCDKFSITQTIKGVIERFSMFTAQQGYQIIFEPSQEYFVVGDITKMEQAIYNLVNNSINYTGEDKTVKIQQFEEDGEVRIEIIDSGEGIPEDDLPHIFERYYRSSKTHKRPTVGTGLGLSIVKTVFESHGAKYGVITSNGQGSVFWFKMPIVK